jgi:hypothetical protein
MRSTPIRGFVIIAGFITALMLTTLGRRNDSFEFCTTRAFGFPFPWWVEWCPCAGESDWLAQVFYWVANLALSSGTAAALTWLARRLIATPREP